VKKESGQGGIVRGWFGFIIRRAKRDGKKKKERHLEGPSGGEIDRQRQTLGVNRGLGLKNDPAVGADQKRTHGGKEKSTPQLKKPPRQDVAKECRHKKYKIKKRTL